MTAWPLCVVLVLASAADASPRSRPRSKKEVKVMPLKLRAQLERAAPDRLRVSYEIRNDGERTVWLLDDMLAFGSTSGFARTPAAIAVLEDDEPATVRLTRGAVLPEADVAFVLIPGARRLDPGGTLSGEAETRLPLMAQTPQDRPRPLKGTRTRAVVEIAVLDEVAPSLRATPLEGGGEAQIPPTDHAFEKQRMLRSDPLELPR
jgi:hypothetical protein